MKRLLALVALHLWVSPCFGQGGAFRLPNDPSLPPSPPPVLTSSACVMFPSDNVWNARVSEYLTFQGGHVQALPVNSNSVAWLATIFSVSPLGGDSTFFHVNLGGTNGHFVNLSDWFPTTAMKIGACKDGGEFTGAYPYIFGTTQLQVGDPDHHCLMIDRPRCRLYECYGVDRTVITSPNFPLDSCCYGYQWNLMTDDLPQLGKSTADEAGLPIAAGLFSYEEVFVIGSINHALRFQTNDVNVDTTTATPIWPAVHTSHPVLPNYKVAQGNHSPIPFGARIRLRPDFVPTGAAANDAGFAVMTAAMKRYGAILADRGSSMIALSGASDSRWGSWPNAFMQYSAQWIPYLEVVDESGQMQCGRASGRFGAGP